MRFDQNDDPTPQPEGGESKPEGGAGTAGE